MEIERGKISSTQLIFITIALVIGIALLTPPGTAVKQDGWLVITVGLVEGIIIVLVYLKLLKRFPGKTLIEICDIVYGFYMGKIVSLIFILYFLHISSLLVNDFANFFSGVIMTDTPYMVFVVLITLVSASAVRNGIEVIARCSQVLIPIVLINIIITTVLLSKQYDFSNLLPVMQTPANKLLWHSYRTGIINFAYILFMMLIPYVNKAQEVGKSLLRGAVIGTFFLIILFLINILVLGETVGIYTYPSFQVARLIDYGTILSRMEIIIALSYFMGGFLEFVLFYYGAVLGTAKVFGLRTYLPLVLPIGILITFHINYYNIAEAIEYQDVFVVIGTIIKLIIPLVTLLIAVIRKLPGEVER